ncbi:hypothetical protein M407DRAFT_246839 [Tulasnella calospora MUT 4182]|uniref:Uncharacterized protein n=1 Tax=Tulasnella calospora MUT 4182 TaxID=1051891 RepID=A0A0C3K6T5_9AGAM|nr:hypothetical protein M407DRAFT_246839 [Tulasnella calospora MUT 4182]
MLSTNLALQAPPNYQARQRARRESVPVLRGTNLGNLAAGLEGSFLEGQILVGQPIELSRREGTLSVECISRHKAVTYAENHRSLPNPIPSAVLIIFLFAPPPTSPSASC